MEMGETGFPHTPPGRGFGRVALFQVALERLVEKPQFPDAD